MGWMASGCYSSGRVLTDSLLRSHSATISQRMSRTSIQQKSRVKTSDKGSPSIFLISILLTRDPPLHRDLVVINRQHPFLDNYEQLFQ